MPAIDSLTTLAHVKYCTGQCAVWFVDAEPSWNHCDKTAVSVHCRKSFAHLEIDNCILFCGNPPRRSLRQDAWLTQMSSTLQATPFQAQLCVAIFIQGTHITIIVCIHIEYYLALRVVHWFSL